MREILFRGKRIEDGEWVYGVPVIGITSGVFMVWIESETKRGHGELSLRDVVKQAEVIPETVGQYTGFKDKNGKRIFEGDVVEGEDYYNYRLPFNGTVGFKDGSFVIFGECITHYRWMDYSVEIIGNIHEEV